MNKLIFKVMFTSLLILGLWGCGKSTDEGFSIKLSGNYSKADVTFFTDFYKSMISAAESEDIDKSLSFYSTTFKSGTPGFMDKLRSNIQTLYVNYKEIKYLPSSITLTIDGDEAVTSDSYIYSAQPETSSIFKKMDYSGKERIYWKKENNEWRIVEWMYF